MRQDTAWAAYQRALGEAVRAARLRANMTEQELADDADVSRAFVQRVEQGLGTPGLRQLWQLSRSLGVRLGDLLPPDRGAARC
jgi:transcriptional regulator with XRE-family HTH domain